MKNAILFLLIMLAFYHGWAQVPQFAWARQINEGSTPFNINPYARIAGVDLAGNVYVSGQFSGTIDLDPGPALFNLTATSPADMYLCKLDASGNFIWGKSIAAGLWAVKIKASGNICIVGSFTGMADFDPGPGVFNITSAGDTDIFVCELDSSGALIWAKSMGGTGSDAATAITFDNNENIYLTGAFSGTADFDPGSNVFNLSSGGAFVCKLSAAGGFIWAKNTAQGTGIGIAIDGMGNIYTTGGFNGTSDFDPGPGQFNLTAAGSSDIFISKLDASGNFIWAKGIGGSNGNISGRDIGISIAAGFTGNVYIAGYYSSDTDFDPGLGTYMQGPSYMSASIGFLLKLDNNGNFGWEKGFGGFTPAFQQANAVVLDASENVYVTGWRGNVGGTMTNDPTFLESYMGKYDAAGLQKWLIFTGSVNDDYGQSIVLDNHGGIYMAGSFRGTVDFDPGSAVHNLTSSAASGDAFIRKMTEPCAASAFAFNYSACDSFSLNGQTYTTSGVYTQTFTKAGGCDSVLVLHITIHPAQTVLTESACDSYTLGNVTYTTDGTYTQTFAGVAGCDSQVVLHLTINTINTSVTQADATLTANTAGAAYQWVTCPGYIPVADATGQSFTATANGSYAVIITQGDCTDTSGCYEVTTLDIADKFATGEVRIFPNPTAGDITITSSVALHNATIRIVSLTGQVLDRKPFNGNTGTVSLKERAAGIYFIELAEGAWVYRTKIIKK